MSHSIEYYTCLCTYSIVYTVPWIRIHSRARSRSVRLWGVRIRSRIRNNPYVSGPGPTPSPSGNKSHTLYTRTEHSFPHAHIIHAHTVHSMRTCTHTQSQTHAHIIHAYALYSMRPRTHTQSHAHMQIHTHTCMYINTHLYIHPYTQNSLTPILTYL